MRDSLPAAGEWAATLDLTRRSGREWAGPCPLCGGEDRFHVRSSGGWAVVGCRGCIDGQSSGERAKRFGELLAAVFPDRGGGVACFPVLRVPRTRPAPVKRREAADSAIAGALWAAAIPADGNPWPHSHAPRGFSRQPAHRRGEPFTGRPHPPRHEVGVAGCAVNGLRRPPGAPRQRGRGFVLWPRGRSSRVRPRGAAPSRLPARRGVPGTPRSRDRRTSGTRAPRPPLALPTRSNNHGP